MAVPLVLRGSAGVSDAGMVEAIEAGITKVNVSTHLNQVLTEQVRHTLTETPNGSIRASGWPPD